MKTTTTLCAALVITLHLCSTLLPAAEPPKPAAEHKKLELLVGEWAYEGTGDATPFLAAAGKFKGKYTARLVLGGFFLQGQGEDLSDNQYLYQDIWLTGYDPAKKSYISHSFENDGSTSVATITVNGNTWTTKSTRTDDKGKVYTMRTVETYAADWKSSKTVAEFSADGGTTWAKAWVSTASKVAP